jgi:hypothetical protein
MWARGSREAARRHGSKLILKPPEFADAKVLVMVDRSR